MKKFIIVMMIVAAASCARAGAGVGGASAIAPEMQPALELLRGLNFTAPSAKFAPAGECADDYLGYYYQKDKGTSGLTMLYAALGALPKGASFDSGFSSARKGLRVSYYDPAKGTIFLCGGETPGWKTPLIKKTMKTLSISEDEFLLVRELGYSLLDQNFGLGGILSQDGGSDRALAVRALAGGDAAMMLTDYLLKNTGANSLALQDPTSVVSRFVPLVARAGRKTLNALPRAVSERMVFPFSQGYNFVLKLRDTGGWPLVNAAYESLPQSTEQVMHPEKYYTKRDVPVEIRFAEADDRMAKAFKAVYEDTVGEFGIRELLAGKAGKKKLDAGAAAAGWGGDRVLLLKDKKGAPAVVWYTTWDSREDAAEFERALRTLYPAAGGAATSSVSISAIGRDVVFISGIKPPLHGVALETAWRASKQLAMTPPPSPVAVSPDSPFFDQQIIYDMLNDNIEPPEADPDFWKVDGRFFTNKKNGFMLTAPNDNWRFQRFTLGKQVITEFTAFHKAYIGSEITLETYDKVLPGEDDPVDDMGYFISRQMGMFTTVSDRKLKVAGMSAREVLYKGFYIVPMTIRYTEVFAPDKTYVFTCAASPLYFDRLKPDFDYFINSLELLNVRRSRCPKC